MENWKTNVSNYMLSMSQKVKTHTHQFWKRTVSIVHYLYESISNYIHSWIRRRWYTSIDTSEEDYLFSKESNSTYQSSTIPDQGFYYQNMKFDIEQSELFSKFKPCTEQEIEESQQDCLIDFSNTLPIINLEEGKPLSEYEPLLNNESEDETDNETDNKSKDKPSEELFYSCPQVL